MLIHAVILYILWYWLQFKYNFSLQNSGCHTSALLCYNGTIGLVYNVFMIVVVIAMILIPIISQLVPLIFLSLLNLQHLIKHKNHIKMLLMQLSTLNHVV